MKNLILFLSLFLAAGAPEAWSQSYDFRIIDFPGAVSTSVNGVNNHGHVVGSYSDGFTSHGFLYDGTDFVTIDYTSLPGSTFLRDINDSGKIVGGFSLAGDYYYTNDFIYDGQSFTSLSFPGNTETYIGGINDAGFAAGGYYDWADNSSNGFLYKDGVFTMFPSTVMFTDANDTGQIIGVEPDFYISALLNGAGMGQINFDQDNNPYGIDIWAWGINDAGVIVGDFYDSDLNASVGFIYDSAGGRVTSLLYPGSTYTGLSGINDLGQLVGSFADADYVTHAFLATPVRQAGVPEPSLFAMLAAVFAVAGCCRFLLSRCRETQSIA